MLATGCALVAVMILFAVGIDLISSSSDRSRLYQLRRVANWLAAGSAYVLFYMARYAGVVINTASTRAMLGCTPSGYGALLSCGLWSYGVCTVLSGGIVDRVGGRRALMLGAVSCCASCGLAGAMLQAAPSYWLLLVLNVCNLGCSTLAALAVVRINVDWYTKVERGTFSGIFGIMISTGYFVALGLGGWIFATGGPGASFLVPAVALALWLPVTATVADTPDDAKCISLSSATTCRREDSSAKMTAAPGATHQLVPYWQAVRRLLADPKIRATMLSLFGTGWVREGFLSWFGSYLHAVAGIEVGSPAHSATTMAITLGGSVGAVALGVVSDRCCSSRRPPVVLGSAVCQAVVLLLYPLILRGVAAAAPPGDEAQAAAVAVVLCGVLSVPLFGALTLLMAAASVELVEPALSGTASGLLNGAQYAGSGLSALAGGAAIEWAGWDALFAQLVLGAFASIAGMARVIWLQRVSSALPVALPLAIEDMVEEDSDL